MNKNVRFAVLAFAVGVVAIYGGKLAKKAGA